MGIFENSIEIKSFNVFSCPLASGDNISIKYNNQEKQTRTKTLNITAIECYFLIRPVKADGKPVREYRRGIHNIWKEQ